jgi:hypothetical protein
VGSESLTPARLGQSARVKRGSREMDIKGYVKSKSITVELVKDRGFQIDEDNRSDYSPNGWEHHAYKLKLSRRNRDGDLIETPVFDWRCGTGFYDSYPEDVSVTDLAPELLDSLVSDATAYTNARNFEDFAADFGYDTDSRKAERIYFACGETAKWLTEFLGGQREYERVANLERL